jgi:phosphatidylglycerophosphate synthase
MIQVSDQKINAPEEKVACLLGECATNVWGLTQNERMSRALERVGIDRVVDVEDLDNLDETTAVVMMRLDYAFEERVMVDLEAADAVVLTVDSGNGPVPVAASVASEYASKIARAILDAAAVESIGLPTDIAVVDPVGLSSSYNEQLRKREAPYVLHVNDASVDAIERRMFGGAYKGVTDFVTKYVWPPPARVVTKWCAVRGIRPNTVTTLSAVLVLLAMWAFARGAFGLGLVAAWGMCFLDTVDGKLARVTLTSSPWGNVFDHGIDLVHPPFWYWAWWEGLAVAGVAGSVPWLTESLWIIVVGYVVGRLMEGFFIAAFGLEIHAWRPADSFFRLITSRRNPNLAILSIFVLVGRPAEGFVAVAVWTILSLGFHAVRIVQALWARARGRAPYSWLSAPVR